MTYYIELLEQLRAECERLECGGLETGVLPIHSGQSLRRITACDGPGESFQGSGVPSDSAPVAIEAEEEEPQVEPVQCISSDPPGEEEKVSTKPSVSARMILPDFGSSDPKRRSSRLSNAASAFLEGDEDMETQYNLLVAKTRREKGYAIATGCFGIGAQEIEFWFAWINKNRLPFHRGYLGWMLRSKGFHTAISTLIVANVAFIIAEANYALENAFEATTVSSKISVPRNALYENVDLIFTYLFATELLLRIMVEELGFFFGIAWRWNVFDACLVAASVTEHLLDGTGIDPTFARVLRVLRMSRALRIIRMFQAFRELRVLLDSIFHIIFPLGWSVLTLSLVIIMFSLVFMNAVNTYLLSESYDEVVGVQLKEYFSSAPQTCFSLFLALTNGQSWYLIVKPLQFISNGYVVVFILFVLLLQLGVLNIITSVFVGNAALFSQMDLDMIQLAEADEHAYTLDKLNDVFDLLDKDSSGFITLGEFEQWTRIEKVRAFFERILGLEAWKVSRFFRMLDINGDETIDRHEFVVGCLRLKGSAKIWIRRS
eukprot:TRINITY_DN16052_c0_g1_i1.p1 TRINITY_DN16052_c0_g1~~TRINITY_DN16052_c0_g1_i1.p1  ORF type:complete len:555 (-),score=53.74 TRINITY_DN16052_c0_g1_i1:330-1964(-)